MEFRVNMAPRTRKGKICEGCGTGMLRVGEGEERFGARNAGSCQYLP